MTKIYNNSGLDADNFVKGELVVVLDPTGSPSSFREGDICTVESTGQKCLYVRIQRTGELSKMYAFRFAKLGHLKIKDLVKYQNKIVEVVGYKGKQYVISDLGQELTIEATELTLVGRRKLI